MPLQLFKLPKRIRSLYLLITLLAVVFLLPLDTVSEFLNIAIRITYLVVLCVAGYLLYNDRRWLTAYISVAVPTLVIGILDTTPGETPILYFTSRAAILALNGLLIFAVFRFSLLNPEASRIDRILAGICGYLIIGFFWSTLYSVTEEIDPDSFKSATGQKPIFYRESASVYYSFVTLTTLGYGDIIPTRPWSRILASMQAVVGTLYLTVFIATLISSARQRE